MSARPPANATQAHRSCKSTITTNVLCVCNMDTQFTYVHDGWEGNANHSMVLEEVIGDQKHGFHGHQQVLSIIVTLTKVILSSIVSSMFMNNLIAY